MSTSSGSSSGYYQESYSQVYQCPDLLLSTRVKKSSLEREVDNGIRVPVMPLPRSKSFHQILRPTINGHMLASNGTIRGHKSRQQNGSTTKVQLSPQPVPQLVSKVKTTIFGHQSKNLLPNKKVSVGVELHSKTP